MTSEVLDADVGVDRGRLAALTAREAEAFAAARPRSRALAETVTWIAARRRPDDVDDALGRAVSALPRRGERRSGRRRRRARVRRPVPRRHGRDGRARARAGRPCRRRAGRGRHHGDAPDRGRGLGRRGARAALRAAALAVHAQRHRREPLRDPDLPGVDRPAEDPRLQRLLPRHRRRDVRDAARRRLGRRSPGQRRPAGRPGADDEGRGAQRPRRARGRARARRRRLRARRARADEHRHRPSRPGLPRGAARADAPDGDAARDRRDAHVQRRAGRLHGGARARARPAHDRQGDRRRRSRRRVRRHRGARAAGARAEGRRLRGRRRRRRHARGQRALAGRRACDARRGADRGGVRADGLARRAARRGCRGRDRRCRGALARDPARRPGRIPLPAAAAAERRRVGRRGRRGAGALPAPVRAQPRRPDHALPQHGARLAGDERGRRRPPHRGLRSDALGELA